jgi:hypothetical protein
MVNLLGSWKLGKFYFKAGDGVQRHPIGNEIDRFKFLFAPFEKGGWGDYRIDFLRSPSDV